MDKNYFEIPLDDIKEGVSLCFRKSHAFTVNARLLNNRNQDPDIVSALLVSAIEELGKGLFLKELHEKGTILIPKEVFGKGFDTHTKKIQRGMTELKEKSLLHPKFFEILSDKNTKFNPNGSIIYSEQQLSQEEISEMFQTRGGTGKDSWFYYKTRLDQNKKFQLFYVNWNDDEKKWEYGMWNTNYQIKNLLNKLENFLMIYHNTDNDYSFEYS